MSDTILARDIAVGSLIRDDLTHARFDGLLVLSEGEEDRANISALDICELCSISLLFGECMLVPLDSILLVIIDGR